MKSEGEDRIRQAKAPEVPLTRYHGALAPQDLAEPRDTAWTREDYQAYQEWKEARRGS